MFFYKLIAFLNKCVSCSPFLNNIKLPMYKNLPFYILIFLFSLSCQNQQQTAENTNTQNSKINSENSKSENAVLVKNNLDTTPKIEPAANNKLSDTVWIAAVGDIMMGSDFPSANSLPPNGGKDMLKAVQPYLETADLTFGNVEGVLSDKKTADKGCGSSANCYTFRSPENYANIWKSVGFDLMSVANNHANDFLDAGRAATANALKNAGLYFAGSLEYPTSIFIHNNIKYGFLAVAPNRGCVELKDYKGAVEKVKKLATEVDIVIVSFHGGAEGISHRNTPCKDEIYLGANRGNVCKLAHDCIDAGADVLLGHGPHVTRGVEIYKERFIAYSMGNFCTYEKFSIGGVKGLAPIFNIKTDKTGKFLNGFIVPTHQIGKGIPQYDAQKRVINEIITLSKSDFPNSPLTISKDGNMFIK
jgi:Bacterial capsule synthesis protein PGA_cap